MSVFSPEVEVAIARVRDELAVLSEGASARGRLLSERVPGTELLVISPAPAPTTGVGPEAFVLCDLDGVAVPDTLGAVAPASAPAHAALYAAHPEVGGIVEPAGAGAESSLRTLDDGTVVVAAADARTALARLPTPTSRAR
jgi:hypothetical protein